MHCTRRPGHRADLPAPALSANGTAHLPHAAFPERAVTEPQGIVLLCPGASLAKVHKVVVQCQANCEALVLCVPMDVANTYPGYARWLLCNQEGEAPAVGEAHAICLSLATGRFGVLHPGQSAVVPVA